MKIIFNASIIRSGGGVQVAHSVLKEWKEFTEHDYCILLSASVQRAIKTISFPDNFTFFLIDPPPSSLFGGGKTRKKIKRIERLFRPEVIFTLFGPPYWKSRVNHVCGYALAQHLYKESPYFSILSLKERVLLKMMEVIKLYSFKHHCDFWIAETDDVADRLSKRIDVPRESIYTVSNTYNGIFDQPSEWTNNFSIAASPNEYKLITISSFHLHKNLTIIPAVIDYLTERYPNFRFVFILTIENNRFPNLSSKQKKHVLFLGTVKINDCPLLYQQADALFMPTILECFTVSYLEAMKMAIPILTSDLSFAHAICQNAALYFNPMSPKNIGDKIIQLSQNKQLQRELIDNGTKRLENFGTAHDRAASYLTILKNSVRK